jgi:hypothetical protein
MQAETLFKIFVEKRQAKIVKSIAQTKSAVLIVRTLENNIHPMTLYTYIPGELVRGWMWCESFVAEGSGIDIVVWGSAKWIVADHPTTPIKKCHYSII